MDAQFIFLELGILNILLSQGPIGSRLWDSIGVGSRIRDTIDVPNSEAKNIFGISNSEANNKLSLHNSEASDTKYILHCTSYFYFNFNFPMSGQMIFETLVLVL